MGSADHDFMAFKQFIDHCLVIVTYLFVQSLLSMSPDQRKNMINDTIKGTISDRVPPATLKEFSIEYFRYFQKLLSIIHHCCIIKKSL